MAKHVVGTVDEIPPGTRKIVEIAGRSIGVFNVNGEYFALLNRCPHQAGPLCKGNIHGFLRPGAVGEYDYSRPGEILRCPWHGWEFDVRTGQSWFDPKTVRVRRYEVSVEPGSALVAGEEDVPPPVEGTTPADVAEATTEGDRPRETEPGMEGMLKGPYVAETYPVTVEQQYVLVEIGR
ncbi:MAG: Rieske (2Fe-2S) protein [Chloroflexota bacterium]|nr:Rieske (2Fe-2S) protein [Chloroflexota bacterium]